MTTRPVVFGEHAVRELRKLNAALNLKVTRGDIRHVLFVGTRRFNQRRFDGSIRWSKTAPYSKDYLLEVIYTEDSHRIYVVTVYMVGYYD